MTACYQQTIPTNSQTPCLNHFRFPQRLHVDKITSVVRNVLMLIKNASVARIQVCVTIWQSLGNIIYTEWAKKNAPKFQIFIFHEPWLVQTQFFL